jgi:hypothetical protein
MNEEVESSNLIHHNEYISSFQPAMQTIDYSDLKREDFSQNGHAP